MKNIYRRCAALAAAAGSLSGCGRETSRTLPTELTAIAATADARWSDWQAPVNLGAPVNSPLADMNPAISRDGLSLYFHCQGCPGGIGGSDIWVSQRSSVDAPWGAPRNLGPNINTEANEGAPNLTIDGHRLFFSSTKPGGVGDHDLYMSRRHDKRDDLGWEPAVSLGVVNSDASDTRAQPFEDADGRLNLYFESAREDGAGAADIYQTVRRDDGSFAPPWLVPELSTPFVERGPTLSRDGLELILASNRPGTLGQLDLWGSSRTSLNEPWAEPQNLGPTVNAAFNDAGPRLSFDGTTLYFQSAVRPENVGGPFFDVWATTRSRVRGRP